MADLINDLASKANIDPQLAQKGLGTVLSVFKDKLPQGVFSQIQAAVPGADGIMQAAGAAKEEASGGIVGAVAGMAGKLFAGGVGEMVSKLTAAGFSTEQVERFLPAMLEFLKNKLPADALTQITNLIPTVEKAAT